MKLIPSSAVATRRFRSLLAAAAVLVAVFSLAGCFVPVSPNQTKVIAWINKDRGAAGLHGLRVNHPASVKAQQWAEHLARNVDATGHPPLKHSNLRQGMEGVRWCSLGENVGWVSRPLGFKGMEEAYMDSPHHRANILAAKFDAVGAGVAFTRDGRYMVTVHEFVGFC